MAKKRTHAGAAGGRVKALKPRFNTNDPDIVGSLPALRRAAKRAWKLAVETKTPFYVIQNGKIVNLNTPKRRKSRQ